MAKAAVNAQHGGAEPGSREPVNAAADGAPGFVWRLVEEGKADATGLRPAGENVIVTVSVWETQQALWDFTYRSGHLEPMQRRRDWFERHVEAHLVLWWVPAGHLPTLDEAMERLADLHVDAGLGVVSLPYTAAVPPAGVGRARPGGRRRVSAVAVTTPRTASRPRAPCAVRR
ncbi:DUF3291 domain-containing protein [Streptomyces sp. NPDC001393]